MISHLRPFAHLPYGKRRGSGRPHASGVVSTLHVPCVAAPGRRLHPLNFVVGAFCTVINVLMVRNNNFNDRYLKLSFFVRVDLMRS